MISFEPTMEQLEYQEAARHFAKEVIRPIASANDVSGAFPRKETEMAWKQGLLHCGLPEEYGGLGLSFLDQAIIDEEIAWDAIDVMVPLGRRCALAGPGAI